MGAVSKHSKLPLFRVSPNNLKKIIEKMESTSQVRMRRTCQSLHNFMEAFLKIIPTQPEDLQLHVNLCEKQNDAGHITLIWIVDGIEKSPISYPESRLDDLARSFKFYNFKKLIITCKVKTRQIFKILQGGEEDVHVKNFVEAVKPVDWFAFQLCIHTQSHEVIFDFCRYLIPVAVELNVYKPEGDEDYKPENIYIRLAMYRGCKTCAFITNNSSYPPIGKSTDCLIENAGFPPEMRQNWSYSIVDSNTDNDQIEVFQGRYSATISGNNSNNEQLDL